MKDNIFIDTNVLIYSYSISEPSKQNIALNVINSSTSYISTQVLNEFANTLYKKFNLSISDIEKAIIECANNFTIKTVNYNTISDSCKIMERYKYSYYDSLIISTAIELKCNTLYTEDLQHNQMIYDKLRIINPFKV